MRSVRYRNLQSFIVVLSVGVAVDAPTVSAQTTAEKPTEVGFQPMFNGVDLKGWKEVQGQPGTFKFTDGVLIANRPGKPFSYWLSTDEKYGDYELRLDYWLPTGGNTGVFIRVPDHLPRTSKKGMEVQIQDDGKRTVPDKGSTAALYNGIPASVFPKQKLNDWNTLAIRCEGPHIVVWINGVKVNDANVETSDIMKDRPRSGYIGLSAHTKEVRFRNVRIQKLPHQP